MIIKMSWERRQSVLVRRVIKKDCGLAKRDESIHGTRGWCYLVSYLEDAFLFLLYTGMLVLNSQVCDAIE